MAGRPVPGTSVQVTLAKQENRAGNWQKGKETEQSTSIADQKALTEIWGRAKELTDQETQKRWNTLIREKVEWVESKGAEAAREFITSNYEEEVQKATRGPG